MNIRDKVSVIGAGCSKFGENYDMSAEDMVVDMWCVVRCAWLNAFKC